MVRTFATRTEKTIWVALLSGVGWIIGRNLPWVAAELGVFPEAFTAQSYTTGTLNFELSESIATTQYCYMIALVAALAAIAFLNFGFAPAILLACALSGVASSTFLIHYYYWGDNFLPPTSRGAVIWGAIAITVLTFLALTGSGSVLIPVLRQRALIPHSVQSLRQFTVGGLLFATFACAVMLTWLVLFHAHEVALDAQMHSR